MVTKTIKLFTLADYHYCLRLNYDTGSSTGECNCRDICRCGTIGDWWQPEDIFRSRKEAKKHLDAKF